MCSYVKLMNISKYVKRVLKFIILLGEVVHFCLVKEMDYSVEFERKFDSQLTPVCLLSGIKNLYWSLQTTFFIYISTCRLVAQPPSSLTLSTIDISTAYYSQLCIATETS